MWGAFCQRSTSLCALSLSAQPLIFRLHSSALRKLRTPAVTLPLSPRYRPTFRLRYISCQTIGLNKGNFLRSLSSGCFLCVICPVCDF